MQKQPWIELLFLSDSYEHASKFFIKKQIFNQCFGFVSSSPVDLGGAASTSSPVSSAVRSLASLSDFSLDLNNGNFDTYSGVQPVTDTMLSGHEASKQVKP